MKRDRIFLDGPRHPMTSPVPRGSPPRKIWKLQQRLERLCARPSPASYFDFFELSEAVVATIEHLKKLGVVIRDDLE